MARYYRRRYTRIVKPKKRWASNIASYSNTPATLNSGLGFTTLVENSIQSSTPTPSIVKTGNFKISIDSYLQFGSSSTASGNAVVQFFVVYVPEGWGTTALATLISLHPEWILASKTVGSSFQSGQILSLDTINLSTRLKRNLNSGDAILLVFQIDPSFTNVPGTVLKLTGHVRYWTCAN